MEVFSKRKKIRFFFVQKGTKESFCPLSVELETNDGNKLMANFANTRITETPMTQLIRTYGQYWSSCSDQDIITDDSDMDNDDEGDCEESLDICESYCNCSNSNPRPNPCGDQLHGALGKKFEKSGFRLWVFWGPS